MTTSVCVGYRENREGQPIQPQNRHQCLYCLSTTSIVLQSIYSLLVLIGCIVAISHFHYIYVVSTFYTVQLAHGGHPPLHPVSETNMNGMNNYKTTQPTKQLPLNTHEESEQIEEPWHMLVTKGITPSICLALSPSGPIQSLLIGITLSHQLPDVIGGACPCSQSSSHPLCLNISIVIYNVLFPL